MLHEPPEPCQFCRLSVDRPVAGQTVVEDDGTARPVLAAGVGSFAVQNRWPLFDGLSPDDPEHGSSEVHLAYRHVTCLEDAEREETAAIGRLLWERRELLAQQYRTTVAVVNVGVNAGGSVAHLHGQVVAANVDGGAVCPQPATECAVCADVADSAARDQVAFRGEATTMYVPGAPGCNLDLRVAATACTPGTAATGGALLTVVRDALLAARALGLNWPYNVTLHAGAHPHAHLFARVDSGTVYPTWFGVTAVGTDLRVLAQQLRQAWPLADRRDGSW